MSTQHYIHVIEEYLMKKNNILRGKIMRKKKNKLLTNIFLIKRRIKGIQPII